MLYVFLLLPFLWWNKDVYIVYIYALSSIILNRPSFQIKETIGAYEGKKITRKAAYRNNYRPGPAVIHKRLWKHVGPRPLGLGLWIWFALWFKRHLNVIDRLPTVFGQIIYHNVYRTYTHPNTKIFSSDHGNSHDLAGLGLGARAYAPSPVATLQPHSHLSDGYDSWLSKYRCDVNV